jgi:dienelactone hydrolase
MKRFTVGKLSIALALVFVVALPLLLFPPYRPLAVTGPYAIGASRYTYTDEQRAEPYASPGENRQINIGFWYPEGADSDETYPLVIFSHGGLGTETSNESLYRELASHGYVVGAIGHPYHAFWTKNADGRVTFVSWEYFGELQREDAKTDKQQSYRYYQKWLETRTADINFALDTILTQAAHGAGGVYALVDGARIGVMGHSLGGSAALAIPRQRDDIAAVIGLEAPYLYDIVGVENDNFILTSEPYPVPVLNVYSDAAWGHLSEWSQYARNYEFLSDPQTKTFTLHLPGAGHFSLTDLSLVSPLLVRFLEGGKPAREGAGYLRDVNKACLEFFDQYLKGRDEFASELLD